MLRPVKDFLRNLPDSWDDVKLIETDPGKSFVVARKAGNKWYVAGLNAEKTEKLLELDLSFLKGRKGQLISSGDKDGIEPNFLVKDTSITYSGKVKIALKGNDGFVMVFL